MSTVTSVDCRMVFPEPETRRTDAPQTSVRQETVLVTVPTGDGPTGTGSTYSIGTGGGPLPALLLTDGCVVPPQAPGIGIDWDEDALDDLRVA
jgi:L-alanine-DL-glutamate epimerase-like enolase superfamily enzyme